MTFLLLSHPKKYRCPELAAEDNGFEKMFNFKILKAKKS
jgi:hypothetical protein